MTILEEYLKKINENRWGSIELEQELKRLIKIYNEKRNTNLIIYASSFNPNLPSALEQKDFYYLKDLLDGIPKGENLDVYIETPGGSGTTAEEIVRYIHSEFNKISFVICGEAKSAGTIMAMSADEILMTKTGSLGPIDAQMISNRGVISAYDYIEWVNSKRKDAEKDGRLNPADAMIIAQITPGELNGVVHQLKYAEDLVKEWLYKYKFKNWNKTETRGLVVTPTMKKRKASSIARKLSNHRIWRTHGRSLKIEDLESIGLKVTNLDDDRQLGDLVYKINLICRLLFSMSNTYKFFCTQSQSLSLNAQSNNAVPSPQQNNVSIPAVIDINHICPKCGKQVTFFAKLINDPNLDKEMLKMGKIPIPKGNIYKCECGFDFNLQGVIDNIERQVGRKIVK